MQVPSEIFIAAFVLIFLDESSWLDTPSTALLNEYSFGLKVNEVTFQLSILGVFFSIPGFGFCILYPVNRV
jgi:hypothetical protein